MSDIQTLLLIGSMATGFVTPVFVNGSFLQKLTAGLAMSFLYMVTMLIIVNSK